ncbi:MAG: DUF1592 domain-containing protein [Polyangiales bacterium]
MRRFAAAALVALALGCDEPAPAADAGLDAQSPPPPAFVPEPVTLRRLTQSQYANALHDLFGDAVIVPRALEPDTDREGSRAVGASETSISPRGTEQYQDAAYAVAEQVLRDPARRAAAVPCTPAGPGDAVCAASFVRAAGRRVWRRPLTEDEVGRIAAVVTRAGTTLMDFHRGAEYGLAALLQAPDFLFRAELGADAAGRAGERRYAGHELAARLSFFLWDSTPDDALLDAAQSGALDTPAGLEREVDRMLASPKARRGLRAFVTDWLQLAKLDSLSKDATIFPSFSADLGASAREEVLRNAEAITFDRPGDFRDFFTSRETFVNRRLAAIYGVQFPVREASATQFERVTLPGSTPRRGFLGSVAFLALEAHPVSTSPTLRGRFVRETLLCNDIPMPPVNVNTAIPAPSTQLRTLRQRLAAHVEVASCRGCHSFIDPPGLAFEHFDGIGRFRATDNGAAIDASGTLDGRSYRDAGEFAAIVRDHWQLPECIVKRAYRHAWGQVETAAQREETQRLQERFAASGYQLRALMREVALGDNFRRAAPPAAATPDGGTP